MPEESQGLPTHLPLKPAPATGTVYGTNTPAPPSPGLPQCSSGLCFPTGRDAIYSLLANSSPEHAPSPLPALRCLSCPGVPAPSRHIWCLFSRCCTRVLHCRAEAGSVTIRLASSAHTALKQSMSRTKAKKANCCFSISRSYLAKYI